jgi:hypothetical protein
MSEFTRLTPDELDICIKSIWDLTGENEAGRTSLDTNAVEFGVHTKLFQKFSEILVREDEFDIVLPPDLLGRNTILGYDRSWRRNNLILLPHYFYLWENLPREECRYGVEIEAFFACCDLFIDPAKLHVIQDFCSHPEKKYFTPEYNELKDLINDFVKYFRKRLLDPDVRKAIRDDRKAVRDRYREFSSYIRKLFAQWSRLIIIRIDLGYQKDVNASIEDLDKDIDHLFRNERHNKKLFGDLKGRIVKFEYGMAKENHTHLVLLYLGSTRNNYSDSYLAKEIGKYWVEVITKGRGAYWNCNDKKQKWERIGRLGIGVIHAEDQERINNLLYIVKYLCKKEQFMKPKSTPKMKLMRKKQAPEPVFPKRGAPRASERKAKQLTAINEMNIVSTGCIG